MGRVKGVRNDIVHDFSTHTGRIIPHHFGFNASFLQSKKYAAKVLVLVTFL